MFLRIERAIEYFTYSTLLFALLLSYSEVEVYWALVPGVVSGLIRFFLWRKS